MRNEVSLIAATIYGNRGAEAMLCTVVGVLRRQAPGTRFNIFSYYPTDDRRRLSAPDVAIHSATPLAVALWLFPMALLFGLLRLVFGRRVFALAPAPIRALARSRMLADLAGVSFIPGREKFLAYNILTLLPAMLLGTPVVKMAQAIGPVDGGLNRLAAKLVLPRCRRIWARGERTFANLRDSGIAGLALDRADDLAFNYEPGFSLSEEAPPSFQGAMADLAGRRASFRGVVGLCPSSVVAVAARKAGLGYEAVLAELVDAVAGAGFLVVLFPNATRDEAGERERNNDLPLVRRIRDACPRRQDAIVAFDMDINTACIKQVIEASDIVLVSRFHAMIGALSQGVPVGVLGWSHKYHEVMARFGQEALVLDYQQASADALGQQVAAMFEQRTAIRAAIEGALPVVRASSRRQLLEVPGDG